MRIVILGTAWPYRGGIAAFNERLAQQFLAEGHQVHIVTFTMQYPDFLFPGKTQYSPSPQPKDLSIVRMLNSINPISWIKTANHIASLQPDILVVRFWIPLMAPCLGTVARLVKRKCGAQIVSILDNVIPHEPKPWDTFFIRYFINSIERFVAMSKSVLQDCEKFDTVKPKTLTVHPIYDHYGQVLPQDQAQQQLGLDPSYTYLLFFGFIRDYKGLDLLLRAYRLMKDQAPEQKVKLLVAGEFYNNSEQYYALEKELQLQGEILWHTDFIPDDKVRLYFSAADLIVQPYKSATQSGVTQVAYHFSKPMLVTNVGGLAEIVPDGKVGYVCPVDPQEIAKALIHFISLTPQQREKQFAQHIQTQKAKYAWTNMVKAVLNSDKQ